MDKPDRSPPREQLWLAINEYVVACSGDPISRVYGNIYRQRAVAAIEAMLDAAPVHAPPAEPTDKQRSIAFNYAEGFAGASTVTAQEVLDAYLAIRDAAPAAEPVAQQPPPCSPTLTVCPRCHNDVSKCDGIFAAQQPHDPAEWWNAATRMYSCPHCNGTWPEGALAERHATGCAAAQQSEAPVAQQPPPECAHEFEVRSDNGQQWTECGKCHITVIPAAQQPPPTLADEDAHWLSCWSEDEMARGNVSNGTRFVQIAARIESDAKRIRVLEAEMERERETSEAAEEFSDLNDRLSKLLTGVANALKGEPPPLTLHSWHDLPELAAASRERERALKAALRDVAISVAGHCELCSCCWHEGEPEEHAEGCLATPDSAASPTGGEG